MNKDFVLEVISPEGSMFEGTVTAVTLPGWHGEITILPQHAPLFTRLTDGEVVISRGSEKIYIGITGGFLEVVDNRVSVLADFAIRSNEIVDAAVEKARRDAEQAIREHKDNAAAIMAEKELKIAIAEIKIGQKVRKRNK